MKIKSVKRYSYRFRMLNFSDRQDHEHEKLSLFTLFNEKELVTEETKYNEDGQAEEITVFRYDAHQNLEEQELHLLQDDVKETIRRTRDENGRLIKEQKFYGSDPGESTSWIYDSSGHVISIEKTDADGQPESTDFFMYDDKKNVLSKETKNGNGISTAKSEFTYNETGLLSQQKDFDENGLAAITDFRYDDQARFIASRTCTPDGKLTEIIEYKYDQNGNIIEKKIRDYHPRRLVFTFDDKNHLVQEEIYDGNNQLAVKNIYTYNEEGQVLTELNYNMDINRSNHESNAGHRFEYEFFPE